MAGQIKWLPKKQDCGAGAITGLDDGCYDHPAVILSENVDSDGAVCVLVVS